MNYNSVEEILASGINNMTVIRNNTKQDDNTDTIQGVDWFSYNSTVATNIYVNGNSYIGFGSDSTHLQVNNRDGAMWYLYREEGTLYNYYKFLKIRWVGYSRYNYTTTAYSLTYDVILWDTGDISLHMVNIPTSYNTGTYSLGSTTYTVSSSSPDVTFMKTDSGFTVSNSIIELAVNKLYLIRSNSIYYTISDGSLSEIGELELTANTFSTYGVDKITDIALLLDLPNPELLFWAQVDSFKVEQGLILSIVPPHPHVVYYDTQSIPNGSSIAIVEVIGNDALFAITFDGGTTWKYFNGNTWVNASTTSEGMTANTFNAITQDRWSEVITSTSFQFRCSLMSLDSTAGKIVVGYA